MVEAGAVLVETVAGDRAKPDQRATQIVDDTTEQKPELAASRLVGAVGNLEQDGPSENGLVEPSRSSMSVTVSRTCAIELAVMTIPVMLPRR